MSKRVKQVTSPKINLSYKKWTLNVTTEKEIQLLAYVVCFIILHNISLHNSNTHSIHSELVVLSILVVSYRPLLQYLSQKLCNKDWLKEVLKYLIHVTFWGGILFISPVVIKSVLTPTGLSLIPCMVVTILCVELPSREVPAPPNKTSSPEETRHCADLMLNNLRKRIKWVGINLVGYSYVVCYMPFTLAKPGTIVLHQSSTQIQLVCTIVHILILLILQALPAEYIVKLTTTANMLGRWQSAVISVPIESLSEWKESNTWEKDNLVRFEDKTYLSRTPTVTAHPASLPHSFLYAVFSHSFRILKILTLCEGMLVVLQCYQILSMKYWQQFLPSSLLLSLNLYTITSIVHDARYINNISR